MSGKTHQDYRDPTADMAIGSVMREDNQRFRKRVFICSPFAGEVKENIAAAQRYCVFAIQNGAAPFAPHLLYPQFMEDDNPHQRDEALRCGMTFLRACHEVWVFGYRISAGMNRELKLAKTLKKPIRYFDTKCRVRRQKGGSDQC